MAKVGTLDDIAEMLEASGRFRCLRRVPPFENQPYAGDPAALRVAVILDVEATGTDPLRDVPIEIAMVKVSYDPASGMVVHLLDEFQSLGEPPEQLGEDVERITGLSMSDLAGRRIDWAGAIAFAHGAHCAIAHNARYDRAIIETSCPDWPLMPWACSLADIDWRAEAQYDRRLGDLLLAHDLYADGHRALADCRSLVHLLSLPLPRSCAPTLGAMLARARLCTAVFFAEGAPFASKLDLRERGYRWTGPDAGAGVPRCWWIEVPLEAARAEAAFLYGKVYTRAASRRPSITIVNAYHRFRPMSAITAARVPAPPPDEEGDV